MFVINLIAQTSKKSPEEISAALLAAEKKLDVFISLALRGNVAESVSTLLAEQDALQALDAFREEHGRPSFPRQ